MSHGLAGCPRAPQRWRQNRHRDARSLPTIDGLCRVRAWGADGGAGWRGGPAGRWCSGARAGSPARAAPGRRWASRRRSRAAASQSPRVKPSYRPAGWWTARTRSEGAPIFLPARSANHRDRPREELVGQWCSRNLPVSTDGRMHAALVILATPRPERTGYRWSHPTGHGQSVSDGLAPCPEAPYPWYPLAIRSKRAIR